MGGRRSPKVPERTAQEKAFTIRSQNRLDTEIEEENRRKRLLLGDALGTQSLLGGGGATLLSQFSGTNFSGAASGRSRGRTTAASAGSSLLSGGVPGVGGGGAGSGGGGVGGGGRGRRRF